MTGRAVKEVLLSTGVNSYRTGQGGANVWGEKLLSRWTGSPGLVWATRKNTPPQAGSGCSLHLLPRAGAQGWNGGSGILLTLSGVPALCPYPVYPLYTVHRTPVYPPCPGDTTPQLRLNDPSLIICQVSAGHHAEAN